MAANIENPAQVLPMPATMRGGDEMEAAIRPHSIVAAREIIGKTGSEDKVLQVNIEFVVRKIVRAQLSGDFELIDIKTLANNVLSDFFRSKYPHASLTEKRRIILQDALELGLRVDEHYVNPKGMLIRSSSKSDGVTLYGMDKVQFTTKGVMALLLMDTRSIVPMVDIFTAVSQKAAVIFRELHREQAAFRASQERAKADHLEMLDSLAEATAQAVGITPAQAQSRITGREGKEYKNMFGMSGRKAVELRQGRNAKASGSVEENLAPIGLDLKAYAKASRALAIGTCLNNKRQEEGNRFATLSPKELYDVNRDVDGKVQSAAQRITDPIKSCILPSPARKRLQLQGRHRVSAITSS